MKTNKHKAQYVLDFSDIEDISDGHSDQSENQNLNPPPPSLPPLPIQTMPQVKIKREIVELPQLLEEEEQPVIRRKNEPIPQQKWQVDFDDLYEQELEKQPEPDQVAHQTPEPQPQSPPQLQIEEPQYIEQYFEDHNMIDEIDYDQQQIEKQKQQLKQDLIKKQSQSQTKKVIQEVTPNKEIPQPPIQKPKQKYNPISKLYNPKNSLIYLRLKGREDLYKKSEQPVEEQSKPEADELLEGLDCINNLLIGLSNVKDKKQPQIEKQKPIPLQIQKHRLDDKGDHLKKSQKKEKDNVEVPEKEKVILDNQLKEAKQQESAQKVLQQQEAVKARQIRHEQLQQQKQLIKQLNQRQVYKIIAKKLPAQGMILYKCCIKEKQRDFNQWLRFSEIALISKGENEIFTFEKRLSDKLFLQLHKANFRSVTVTKKAIFDVVLINYNEDNFVMQEEYNVKQQKDKNKRNNEKSDQKQNLIKNTPKKNTEKKQRISEMKEMKESSENEQQEEEEFKTSIQRNEKNTDQQEQKSTDIAQVKQVSEAKRIKNKIKYIESEEEDADCLDADKIRIFRILGSAKKQEKRDKQKVKESKTEQKDSELENHKPIINKIEVKEQSIQKESLEKIVNSNIKEKETDKDDHKNTKKDLEQVKQINDLVNEQNEEQKKQDVSVEKKMKENGKKSKVQKFQEYPLSRLETNDDIKKKEKINQKKKEKRKQQYLQLIKELEEEKKQKELETQQLKAKLKEKQQKQQNENKNLNGENNKNKDKQTPTENQKIELRKNNGKIKSNKLIKMKTRSEKLHFTRSSISSCSRSQRSQPRQPSVEPGYISTRRVYEKDLNKRKKKVIEDEDFDVHKEDHIKKQIKRNNK